MPLALRTAADEGQSKITTIAGVAVSGWVKGQSPSASPTFRVWRRKVSIGNALDKPRQPRSRHTRHSKTGQAAP